MLVGAAGLNFSEGLGEAGFDEAWARSFGEEEEMIQGVVSEYYK